MARFSIITTALFFLSFCLNFAQTDDETIMTQTEQAQIDKWELGFDMNYCEMKTKPSVNIGLSGSMIISKNFSIGLKGTAVWYDHRLSKLDAERTYHLESAYGGLVFEPSLPITDKLKISMPIYLGTGVVQYKYDGKYRDELTWTEETIDREIFSFFEPGITLTYRVNENIGVSAMFNYRMTGEIKLIETDDDLMTQANYGLAIKYYLD